MEIIIGLAIATLLVVGWAVGNVFAAVFITLGCLFIGGFCLLISFSNPGSNNLTLPIVAVTAVVGIVAWLPILFRRNA